MMNIETDFKDSQIKKKDLIIKVLITLLTGITITSISLSVKNYMDIEKLKNENSNIDGSKITTGSIDFSAIKPASIRVLSRDITFEDSTVSVQSLIGKIPNNKIEDIPTSQLIGLISEDQLSIFDGSKIKPNTLSTDSFSEEIPSNKIENLQANKIVGLIASTNIRVTDDFIDGSISKITESITVTELGGGISGTGGPNSLIMRFPVTTGQSVFTAPAGKICQLNIMAYKKTPDTGDVTLHNAGTNTRRAYVLATGAVDSSGFSLLITESDQISVKVDCLNANLCAAEAELSLFCRKGVKSV
jgi:hypothetical protein